MNIFVCSIISIGIILALWLIGNLIEWICDKLHIDTFEFVSLIIIISVLTLWLYTLTN
jgi:uncharacterized membrane protein